MNRYLIGLLALGMAYWVTSGGRLDQLGSRLADLGRSVTDIETTTDGTAVSSAPQAVSSLDTIDAYGNLVQRQSQAGSTGVAATSTSVFDQPGTIPSQTAAGQDPFTSSGAIPATGTNQPAAGGDISPIGATGIPPTRTTVSGDSNLESIPALW